jgi:hypothetical protein
MLVKNAKDSANEFAGKYIYVNDDLHCRHCRSEVTPFVITFVTDQSEDLTGNQLIIPLNIYVD